LTKEAKESRELRVASTQFIIGGMIALTVYAMAYFFSCPSGLHLPSRSITSYNESGQQFWTRLTSDDDVQTGVAVL